MKEQLGPRGPEQLPEWTETKVGWSLRGVALSPTWRLIGCRPMQAWRARRRPALWSWFAIAATLWLGCQHRPAEAPSGFPPGMTRPHPVTPIDWSYPPDRRLVGTLSVRCVITEEGQAQDCRALKSIPGVDAWVIDKLESAPFVPATYQGKPVRISYVFNFRFDVPATERSTIWRPPLKPGEAEECKGSNGPGCVAAALALLAPDAGRRDPDRAGRLLGAACAAGLVAACRRLDESFQAPRLLEDVPPPPIWDFTGAEGEIICWVSAIGQAHDCRGPDSAPGRWLIEQLTRSRFAPATFEREPFETEYALRFSFTGHR
jgi:hypothetical protein